MLYHTLKYSVKPAQNMTQQVGTTHTEKQTTDAMLPFCSIMHVRYCPCEWAGHSVFLLTTVAVQFASPSGRTVVFPEMILSGA